MCPIRLRMAMELLGGISLGDLARASGVSKTSLSLLLAGRRKLRPAMEVRIIQGLEREFKRKGSRLDTVFFDSRR